MPQTQLRSDTIDTDNITSMVEFMFQLEKRLTLQLTLFLRINKKFIVIMN